MSKKVMFQVDLFTSKEGTICIHQDDAGNGDDTIELHPNQVDTIIGWLQEAKKELS